MGAAALETFSTNTLQDPAKAATVWDTNGGRVTVDNVTPVQDEPVPTPPAICAPGAGECRALGGSAPTCTCPQTATDFRPNCLETDSLPAPWAPTAPAGTCVVGGAAAPACQKLLRCDRVPAGLRHTHAASPGAAHLHLPACRTCAVACLRRWRIATATGGLGLPRTPAGCEGRGRPQPSAPTLPPPSLVCSNL